MKRIIICLICLTAAAAFGGEGKNYIEFPAKNGTVPFNHGKHINLVKKDCSVCHAGRPAAIEGFNKNMAHKLCIDCHEELKTDWKGPISCPGCHGAKPS